MLQVAVTTDLSLQQITEFLAQGIQTLSQSQILQQTLGPALPKMFTHLMSLGGVKGMEEYLPETQPMSALPAPTTGTQGAK